MKRLISIILVFGILNITFSGCTSSKLLSVEEASQMQNNKKSLILHIQNKTYKLNDYEFTDTKLKGELNLYQNKAGNYIHAYTQINFNSNITQNGSQYFEMDKSDINKITVVKIKTGSTIFVALGGLFGIVVIAGAIAVNNMHVNPW